MDGIKREIMFEKDWNQPCVHIDVPVPYEEDYQMKMLRYNEIDGLLRVSGIGREEESRYTYQTRGGISLEKKYENKNIESSLWELSRRSEIICLIRTAFCLAPNMCM